MVWFSTGSPMSLHWQCSLLSAFRVQEWCSTEFRLSVYAGLPCLVESYYLGHLGNALLSSVPLPKCNATKLTERLGKRDKDRKPRKQEERKRASCVNCSFSNTMAERKMLENLATFFSTCMCGVSRQATKVDIDVIWEAVFRKKGDIQALFTSANYAPLSILPVIHGGNDEKCEECEVVGTSNRYSKRGIVSPRASYLLTRCVMV